MALRPPHCTGDTAHTPRDSLPTPTAPSTTPPFHAPIREVVDVNGTTALFIGIAVWIAIGVVASVFMGRRGHSPYAWLVLGTILGPLVGPVAVVSVSEERVRQRREVIVGLGAADGNVDVLVWIDGSPESTAALPVVGPLFGRRIGRLTIATGNDSDRAGSITPARTRSPACTHPARRAPRRRVPSVGWGTSQSGVSRSNPWIRNGPAADAVVTVTLASPNSCSRGPRSVSTVWTLEIGAIRRSWLIQPDLV